MRVCGTTEILNIWTPESIIIPVQKLKFGFFFNMIGYLKDADGMANSVDPGQTAPSGAV